MQHFFLLDQVQAIIVIDLSLRDCTTQIWDDLENIVSVDNFEKLTSSVNFELLSDSEEQKQISNALLF